MSKYTVEMSHLINSGFNFGLDLYPIFDETYRAKLNQKILDHYRYYEIGMETPGRFKFALNREMNEIMPLYNQRYLSARMIIEPLLTQKLTETSLRKLDGTGSDNTVDVVDTVRNDDRTIDENRKSVFSDTPSKFLEINDIEANTYASNAQISSNGNVDNLDTTVHDDRTSDRTLENHSTDDFTREFTGFTESQSKLLIEYRKTFLNIDMEVIASLNHLFMQLW